MQISQAKVLFEQSLRQYLDAYPGSVESIMTPMRYAVEDGGKRLRPMLAYCGAEFCGGTPASVTNLALAIEMIHSYSLVHDDLPCMDNDTLRRGKPTVHVAYGEDFAVLAGDGLLTMAFEAALSAPGEGDHRLEAVAYLARAAGINGMIGGQAMDVRNTDASQYDLDTVTRLYAKKTGALLRAALCGAAIQCGVTPTELQDLEAYAYHLGMVFQITDDILDVTSTTEVLGKNVGKDAELDKRSYAHIVGVEQARADVKRHCEQAIAALASYGTRGRDLCELCRTLTTRSC